MQTKGTTIRICPKGITRLFFCFRNVPCPNKLSCSLYNSSKCQSANGHVIGTVCSRHSASGICLSDEIETQVKQTAGFEWLNHEQFLYFMAKNVGITGTSTSSRLREQVTNWALNINHGVVLKTGSSTGPAVLEPPPYWKKKERELPWSC